MKVRDIMTKHVVSVDTQSSLNEVAKQMRDLNIGSVPVCDSHNTPVGIVTDRDIVVRAVSDNLDASSSVDKVMSKELIWVSPDAHAHEAARLMSENQIRRLPVVENGQIVGMLAIGDLAVRNIYVDDAGKALSDISTPSRPMK